MKTSKVSEWMSRDVITVQPNTTLPEAHAIMRNLGIRRLPIVDTQERLVGIITLGDIRGAEASPATTLSIWELNYLIAKLKVKEIMTKDPLTVRPDTTIGEAAMMMHENKVGGLPVIDEMGKLIGIITESDIFEMVVLHEWRSRDQELAST
ncbi:MAG: CBS domain-containing protein [Anaerolineales bacterium]|nr:CBS domain-containing protein [Anaerolineales bacterium]